MAHGDIKTRNLNETKSSSSSSCVSVHHLIRNEYPALSNILLLSLIIKMPRIFPAVPISAVRCSPPLSRHRSRSLSIWWPCFRCCGGTGDGSSHGCDRRPTMMVTAATAMVMVMSKANSISIISTGRLGWNLHHPFWTCPSRPRSIPPRRLHHREQEDIAACWQFHP
jgi:hypothetical protein